MADLRGIPDRWRGAPVTVRDLPLALALAVAPLIPTLHNQGTQLGDGPQRPTDALAVVAVLLESLPLAGRRRWPAASLALVSLGFAIDQLGGYHTVASIALPLSLFSAAAYVDRGRRTTVVLASASYAVLAVALQRQGSTEGVGGFVTFYLVLAIAWGIGAWLRQSRAAEADHRRHVAESTRTAERTRIARELHDVVTHHVTAMVVQAEAARYLTADPDALDRTLGAVSDTGRRAIGDLRHVLDLLDPDHGPELRTPSVGELGELVEQTRQAGQPVEYVEEGAPAEIAGGAEVAAYRVVQEALTNALKYARGRRTSVHVRHGSAGISVAVSTEGHGVRGVSPGGSGRGLDGLRDRVEVLGGELSAGPQEDGTFLVRASIPLAGPS